MGIKGLLPLLSSIQKPTHLRNFAGQTLGIDAYGWLHRGTIACAIDLAEGTPTRKHIDFALNRVRMLIHFGVKPYLVFDGDYLPSKAHTEKDRAARRRESKKLGLESLRMGRKSLAQIELQKSIDVTPSMARELIEELKLLGVSYVVAPYEADSQMAYLEKQGVISGVISEDSDLLVFGVKCLITKLDQYGEAVAINRADFTACREISLVGWSDKEFRTMAMLSGCDYLPGIENIGLKTAYRYVRKHKKVDNVIRAMQFDAKVKVPVGFLEAFHRAENTFLYQWVFCPEAKALLNLNQLPAHLSAENMPYIGKFVEPETAAGVACGELDPNTKLPIPQPLRLVRPPQRRFSVQTPDHKQGKPIQEFFKSRRTPLAELDPNSFTPSPSQQRLLENHENSTWSASRVDVVGPVDRRQSDPIRAAMSAPQATRRVTSHFHPTQRTESPKRQRLCSSSTLAEAMKGAEDIQPATSRFFTPKAQASPSVRKKPKSKASDEEFGLWSDDSVSEALAAVVSGPEVAQSDESASTTAPLMSSPRKRKKINIFRDSTLSATSSAIATPASATSQSSSTTDKSSAEDYTPCTSFTSEDDEHALHIRARLASSRADSASNKALTSEEEESQSPTDVIPNSSPGGAPPARQNLVDDEQNEDSSTQPRPRRDLLDNVTFDTTHGSEDMLIPNSPTSDDSDQHDDRTITATSGTLKFDLRRFAYAG